MRTAALLGAALLLGAAPAEAGEQDHRPWSVKASGGYLIMGPKERPTGGFAPTLGGSYTWRFGDDWRLSAGVSGVATNLGSLHWLSFLVGPELAIEAKPFARPEWLSKARVRLGVSADYGRVTICTDWGWCEIRWWAVSPRASLGVSYEVAPAFSFEVGGGARRIVTPPWAGVSPDVYARGVFSF